jgi:hypothetical protein
MLGKKAPLELVKEIDLNEDYFGCESYRTIG